VIAIAFFVDKKEDEFVSEAAINESNQERDQAELDETLLELL